MNIALPGKARVFQARQREQADRERTRLGIEARAWYRISNQAADEAEVMLYDEVGGWFGATADEFIADLRGITAPNLRLRINSPGGSVFEGIAIANALRAHPANVTVQVDGIAASIASVIAMAGDRIEMAPNSMLMIHDASGVCMGNASDMEEMGALLDLISDNIADAYASRAGGTRDEWRDRMRAETWYLPEDAVTAGLADEAVQTPKAGEPAEPDEESEMARAFDPAAYGYQGPRAEGQPEAGLTEDIRSLIGDEVAAQLKAAVVVTPDQAPADQTPAAEEALGAPSPLPDTAPVEPAPDPTPTASASEDPWAALTAHLTQDEPDAWSVLVSNLTTTTSSSAATEA